MGSLDAINIQPLRDKIQLTLTGRPGRLATGCRCSRRPGCSRRAICGWDMPLRARSRERKGDAIHCVAAPAPCRPGPGSILPLGWPLATRRCQTLYRPGSPLAHPFTRLTWRTCSCSSGTLLAPGRRTVTAALRILGRRVAPRFLHLPPGSGAGEVVVPRRGRTPAPSARRRLRPRPNGHRHRPRRYHRAKMGAEDQRPRHLSRSCPILQRPFVGNSAAVRRQIWQHQYLMHLPDTPRQHKNSPSYLAQNDHSSQPRQIMPSRPPHRDPSLPLFLFGG